MLKKIPSSANVIEILAFPRSQVLDNNGILISGFQ